MPAGAPLPFVELMYAVMARLKEVDLSTLTGIDGIALRFARNRYTTRHERPCLAIAFVSDEPADDGAVSANPDETVRVLALDLIVDLEIETEASAEANDAVDTPVDEFDPTGLSDLSKVLGQAGLALRECSQDPLKDTTDLGRKTDWVENISIDDDDELPDDDGRLVGRLNVIYRTSSWDPTVLLERT